MCTEVQNFLLLQRGRHGWAHLDIGHFGEGVEFDGGGVAAVRASIEGVAGGQHGAQHAREAVAAADLIARALHALHCRPRRSHEALRRARLRADYTVTDLDIQLATRRFPLNHDHSLNTLNA